MTLNKNRGPTSPNPLCPLNVFITTDAIIDEIKDTSRDVTKTLHSVDIVL